MSKRKDLTIEEYKETPLNDIDDANDSYNNEKFNYEDRIMKKILKYDDDADLDLEKNSKSNKGPKKKAHKGTFTKEKATKPKKIKKGENSSKKYEGIDFHNKANKIINLVFSIIIVIMLIVSVDVICVGKYNKGPFFAIKTSTEKDGGTKIYYGLGYKVIKYYQLEGRRGMEIGTWKLKYNVNPLELSALDLAIEFTNDAKSAYNSFYNKYVKVTGTLINKDIKNNNLTLAYQDEDNKYTLNIICTMDKDAKINDGLEEQKNATIVGTITKYEIKDGKKILYINDCFIK